MNMHPKMRPLWQRLLLMTGVFILMVYKALRLPRFILPRDFKAIVNNWPYEMFTMLLKSGFTKAYIDQPCYLKMPADFKPRADVAEANRMSEDEIRGFYEKGYAGPFDCFSREEMADFKRQLLTMEDTVSETYNFVTPRDRHFECPKLWNFMKDPVITDRVAQILGPDLLCWRSQIFYKGPHAPAIQWHQATTFMVEDYQDPAIFPPDRSATPRIRIIIALRRGVQVAKP